MIIVFFLYFKKIDLHLLLIYLISLRNFIKQNVITMIHSAMTSRLKVTEIMF